MMKKIVFEDNDHVDDVDDDHDDNLIWGWKPVTRHRPQAQPQYWEGGG